MKHGFEEMPRSKVEGVTKHKDMQDVYDFNVRLIAYPLDLFGINLPPSELENEQFRFRRKTI